MLAMNLKKNEFDAVYAQDRVVVRLADNRIVEIQPRKDGPGYSYSTAGGPTHYQGTKFYLGVMRWIRDSP